MSYRFARDVVRECLGERKWREWLDETFSNIVVKNVEQIEAIAALVNDCKSRLVTTNYDRVIEQTSRLGLRSCKVDPSDESEIESFLRGDCKNVFHLHGVYTHPDSVVLGNVSYGMLTGGKLFDYVHDIYKLQMIFIGFQSFDDPTFTRLREYQRQFKYSRPHFVLVTQSTADKLANGVVDDGTISVVYGDHFDELAAFLHALRDVAVSQDPLPS